MKKANSIRSIRAKRKSLIFVSLSIILFGNASQILAHGGEEETAPTVKTGGTEQVRTVRINDFEVTMKNAAIEPDTAASARIFLTRFATNEPVTNAKVWLTIERQNNQTDDIEAVAADTPGTFLVTLPPIPQGTVRFRVRVEAAGATANASLGDINIAHDEAAAASDGVVVSSWGGAALIAFVFALVLMLLGGLVYFVWRFAGEGEPAREETVSA